jgi:chromosomal replication initiator protein
MIDKDRILDIVAAYYGVSRDQILAKGRAQRLGAARSVSMYFCREITGEPFIPLGKYFGRDHSTVIFAWQKVGRFAADHPPQAALLRKLREIIETPCLEAAA